MAVYDVGDLLRMLRRGAGEELEQTAGPEAITGVQEMDGVIRERLRQSDMYFSLWNEFDRDTAPDLWDMLAWNLRDVREMLPVIAQSVLAELEGPSQPGAGVDGARGPE